MVATVALGLAAVLLAGCGDSGDDDAATENSSTTVQDAFGETEIPTNPQRVIADSVGTFAHLASLGITPVGVAFPTDIDPAYIGVDTENIENVVAEDGWTIDVEQALTLKPDLIVGVGADYNKENCERYAAAVATFCFEEIYETGTDADIKDTVRGIAAALGREDEANAEIAAYEKRIADTRERVEDAGLTGTKVGIVRFGSEDFIGIRVEHSGNALLQALGFAAPEFGKANVDGYRQLSLETLAELDKADELLINADDNIDVDELPPLKSPLWKRLNIVKDGRAHFVTAWNGGDLPQMQTMLDDIEAVLVEPAESGATTTSTDSGS